MTQRLLLISPVHNEQTHIERVAEAVARQTRPPDLWVIVDDRSTDRTPGILAALERQIDFLQVIDTASLPSVGPVKDRLATAAEARAFNLGLGRVDWCGFSHIAKLDGDTELPGDYFERLLDEFERDSRLGLAGGMYADPDGDGTWKLVRVPSETHVPGTLKCYSLACFAAIGGMQERLGWDTIDEVYARMNGFRTRSFEDLVARHHRPAASADGILRGRARYGQCLYITHFTLTWVTLRAVFKASRQQPRGISGMALLYGYLRSAARGDARVEDPAFRRFMRRELRQRMLRAISPARLRGRRGGASSPVRATGSQARGVGVGGFTDEQGPAPDPHRPDRADQRRVEWATRSGRETC
jgi:glycosyltransferase involved in cell wall biosynthesis